jgi:hypothetical protein
MIGLCKSSFSPTLSHSFCLSHSLSLLLSLSLSLTLSVSLTLSGRVGLFGRKANPFVKATYGDFEKLSPTYVCDNDSPLSDKALVFNVTDDVNSLVRIM